MNYYNAVENIIKKNEVNKKARIIEENYETVNSYWHIGKIIVEAQGGEKRAKYGNELIKKWSVKLTEKDGKGYDSSNLRNFRRFYLLFQNCDPVGLTSWTNLRTLLPIKDENKRNYYLNLCISKKLSSRELQKEIKNNSYERLIAKPDKIEITNYPSKLTIKENMKNPILISIPSKTIIAKEQDLEIIILSQIKTFFNQLGGGYTLVGNQYKINDENNKNYYIDILLFNYKINCFIVVELKLRKLEKEDKGQIEFYMSLVDEKIKEPFHNKTIGLIITKEQDKLIVNFVQREDIIPLVYELINYI